MAARSTGTHIIDAPAPEPDIESVIDELGQTSARVKLYRRTPGQPNAYLGSYEAAGFSLDLIAKEHGGGSYEVQITEPDSARVARRKIVEIDRSIPSPRRAPATATPARPSWFEAPPPPVADDPQSVLLREIAELRRQIGELRSTGQQGTGSGITVRDMFDIFRAQQQPNLLEYLPRLMEMLKPKSTVEELFAAQKLFRSLSRSSGPDEPQGSDSAESTLLGLLNSPIGQKLAERFLTDQQQQAQPSPPQRVQLAPASLPAGSGSPARSGSADRNGSQARSATPGRNESTPPVPPIVAALAPTLAAELNTAKAAADFDVQRFAATAVDQCGGPDIVADILDQLVPGQLSQVIISAGGQPPELVFMLEGMIRQLVADVLDGDEPAPADIQPDTDTHLTREPAPSAAMSAADGHAKEPKICDFPPSPSTSAPEPSRTAATTPTMSASTRKPSSKARSKGR